MTPYLLFYPLALLGFLQHPPALLEAHACVAFAALCVPRLILLAQLLVVVLLNALWQWPLLVATTAACSALTRPRPHTAHLLWLATLAFGVLLPFAALLHPGQVLARQATPAALLQTDVFPQPAVSPTRNVARLPAQPTTPVILRSAPGSQKRPAGRPVLTLQALALLDTAWLLTVLLGGFRLIRHRRALQRLLATAHPLCLPAQASQQLTQVARLLHVRAPTCQQASLPGPALVGLRRPRLLLPAAFSGYTPIQRRAVFAHELAHLRRLDPLTQQLIHLLAIPLLWHPVTVFVLRQLAVTREFATDALAAHTLHSPHRYAVCLIDLAQSILSASAAPVSAFGLGFLSLGQTTGPGKPNQPNQPNQTLEQRIMRLIRPVPTLPSRYRIPAIAFCTLLVGTATALAVAFPMDAPALATASPAAQSPSSSASVAAPQPNPAPRPAAHPASALSPSAPPPALTASPAHPSGQHAAPPNRPPAPAQPPVPGSNADADQIRREVEQSTAYLRSPEFQQQMRDAAKVNVNADQIRREVEQSTAYLRSPEFQQQMRDAAKVNVNADQIRREVDNATAYIRSPEFQKDMRDATKSLQQPAH